MHDKISIPKHAAQPATPAKSLFPSRPFEGPVPARPVAAPLKDAGPTPARPGYTFETIGIQARSPLLQPRLKRWTAPRGGGIETARSPQEHTTGLPAPLKTGLERFSGLALDDVQVHYNSSAPAQVQALAYTYGTEIHVGPGHEAHLPHEAWHVVQQKQGRVPPTRQVHGLPLNAEAALEQEATMMGAQAVQLGWAVPGPLGAPAPERARPPVARGAVVQRRMGAEAEIKMAVTDHANRRLEGEVKLAKHPYFKLVTDHRRSASKKPYSNLEFVMEPFDELVSDADAAHGDLDKRLAAMKQMYDQIYAVKRPSMLTNALSCPGASFPEAARNVKINPQVSKDEKHDLVMVHYTIGFPIPMLFEAMRLAELNSYELLHARPQQHARAALKAALKVNQTYGTRLRSADEHNALKGVVALLHAQIAAFADSVGGQLKPQDKRYKRGQIKNKTALLSRVHLFDIYEELKERLGPVQGVLQDNRDDILRLIAKAMKEETDLDFGKDDEREAPKEEPITLKAYASAGLGVDVRTEGGAPEVTQERVFGGMNTVGIDRKGIAGPKVPVELRSLFAQFRTWKDFEADAHWLVDASRAIILGQQTAPTHPLRQEEREPKRQRTSPKPAERRTTLLATAPKSPVLSPRGSAAPSQGIRAEHGVDPVILTSVETFLQEKKYNYQDKNILVVTGEQWTCYIRCVLHHFGCIEKYGAVMEAIKSSGANIQSGVSVGAASEGSIRQAITSVIGQQFYVEAIDVTHGESAVSNPQRGAKVTLLLTGAHFSLLRNEEGR